MTRIICAATFAALVACAMSGPVSAESAALYNQVKIDAGKALYDGECHRCHANESEDVSYGPPLENIIGRGAGTVENYDYSIALAASGIVWTEAALRAWMEDNTGFMPGTKMRHVGIEDRTVQDFILAYLRSITTRDGAAVSEKLTKD
ncbi:cytochrome C [Litorivita pollutaquae]|uniref:Cytochrome C n=1 Tax=Litorivita pollutaquae TaxID=2200892 RepID=A0A2V4MLK7_9RHOB|nr:c-type cytochrome [Litorivita pollutaquae]PYC47551.1 cytochrome C [Litorivita pollutaquae]